MSVRSLPCLAAVVVSLVPCLAGLARAAARDNPAGDPFAGGFDGKPPRILREIREPLKNVKVPSNVIVRQIVFFSRTGPTKDKGLQDSEVYAVVARPATPGRYPGMLILHGGAGAAEASRAVAWASRGYIAVAPDLPGIASPDKAVNSRGRAQDPYGSTRFIASPDLTASSLFDSVLAGMQSLYLLRAQPDVRLDRIGVEGVSWGGYMTTMLCGLAGSDVHAGFSLYGCGYHEFTIFHYNLDKFTPAERERWMAYFDAGRRAARITAPFFIVAPSKDNFFWPPAVSATLEQIPGEKNQVILPNANHAAPCPGGAGPDAKGLWTKMEADYFDYYLKGEGQPFPRVTAQPSDLAAATNGHLHVGFTIESPTEIRSATVWYSAHGPQDEDWRKRTWLEAPAAQAGANRYEAAVPVTPGQGLEWFALVSDVRPVSVSSPMQYLARPAR